METREEGYYWVFYRGEWIIAQYVNKKSGQWWICEFQVDGSLFDSYFTEIDERRIINPNEK
jgi:hypothetical protein